MPDHPREPHAVTNQVRHLGPGSAGNARASVDAATGARQVGADGNEQHVGESYGHVSLPYPREYASFEPDVERLTRAAATTGGRVNPAPRALFDPGNEKIVYHEELWNRFILASLAAFLLDLLVRRVRLFDRKFLPKRTRAAV